MRKARSHGEILSRYLSFSGNVWVDVGCGTGEMVRWMAGQGAEAIGIDLDSMVAKAAESPQTDGERYLVGRAQALPLPDHSADALLYVASLHHVPVGEMHSALAECARVMRPSASAFFIEPVAQPGAYSEIVRLVKDEARVQAEAHEALNRAHRVGLVTRVEECYYLERSFEDFIHLLDHYLEDESRREEILGEARDITERMAREVGSNPETFRFRSICRLMVLGNEGKPRRWP
jgi:ubiquinone/menaquinone biosynthesis C-methylase UbiE